MMNTEDCTKHESSKDGWGLKRVLKVFFPLLFLFILCDTFLLTPFPYKGAVDGDGGSNKKETGGKNITIEGRRYYEVTMISHFHTILSDGGGDLSETIEAARMTGGDVLLPTDHDRCQTRKLPAWDRGVLVIPGIEISAKEGHIVAINPPVDLPKRGRPAKEYIDLVHLNGGLLYIAHPFKWREEWKGAFSKDFDGIEVVNMDSLFRENFTFPFYTLMRGALLFPFAKFSSVISLMKEDEMSLNAWDNLTGRGERCVGVSGTDAHSSLKVGSKVIRFPSYDFLFSLCQNRLLLAKPLEGDATKDMKTILYALSRGNLYITFPFLHDPEGFVFYATVRKGGVCLMGEELILSSSLDIVVRVPELRSKKHIITLLRNGEVIARSESNHFSLPIRREGTYRVEVDLIIDTPSGFEKVIPWIYSNPIFITEG